MTRQEFISRQQAMTRTSNKRTVGWMIFFFGALFGGIPLSRYVENHPEVVWLDTAVAMGFVLFVVGNLGLMFWYSNRLYRRFEILCSGCKKPLIGTLSQIAIASGNCGHCGHAVFSDSDAAVKTSGNA